MKEEIDNAKIIPGKVFLEEPMVAVPLSFLTDKTSLLDQFAIAALPSMLSYYNYDRYQEVADSCYAIGRFMIRASSKK